ALSRTRSLADSIASVGDRVLEFMFYHLTLACMTPGPTQGSSERGDGKTGTSGTLAAMRLLADQAPARAAHGAAVTAPGQHVARTTRAVGDDPNGRAALA